MESKLTEFERALGHRFTRPELLVRALTHRSLANQEEAQGAGDNERLEFLGDAVLGLVVGEALYEVHPEWREGELTQVRSQLVSRKHMTEVAVQIGLGEHIRLSRGEAQGGLRHKATVLSNAMEAVLAALYLDGGLEVARGFARRWVIGEAEAQLARELSSGEALGNFKSALQERLQASHSGIPFYRMASQSGPDHRKRFVVEVCCAAAKGDPGTVLASGTGSSKKLAEQDAARRALEALGAAAEGSESQGGAAR